MMYEIQSKQLIKKGKALKQMSEGSPIYRFYSAESGYILPNHEAELISGLVVNIPSKYKGIVKSCIDIEKGRHLQAKSFEIQSFQSQPLCLKVKNISDSPIEIKLGEAIGTLTIQLK